MEKAEIRVARREKQFTRSARDYLTLLRPEAKKEGRTRKFSSPNCTDARNGDTVLRRSIFRLVRGHYLQRASRHHGGGGGRRAERNRGSNASVKHTKVER